jgi:hypothetical protein
MHNGIQLKQAGDQQLHSFWAAIICRASVESPPSCDAADTAIVVATGSFQTMVDWLEQRRQREESMKRRDM